MALLRTNTGIGTTNPTSALHVIGDVLVTGVVTATTFNGNINAGVGTIVNLTSTRLISDVGTVTDLTNTRLTSGIATITSLTNTRMTSGVSTITTLDNRTATILDLDNLRMLSGIATITEVDATTIVSVNADLQNINANFGNIDVGIITALSGTRLNYTGVGTITTLNSTTATITDLTNTRLTSGIATIATLDNTYFTSGVSTITTLNNTTASITDLTNTRLTSGIATITDLTVTNSSFTNLNINNLNAVTGVITDLSGTRLNYTGVGTVTTLNSTNATLTNINSSGISTLSDIKSERITATGIITANSFRPSSGYIQAADGTNSFYIYDGTGNAAFQGTIGASQVNNASGFKVIGFAGTDITFENDARIGQNAYILGVTTSVGGFVGDLTGTATTSTKLETPRTFEITGDIVASPITFDGTGNVSLAATIQPDSVGLGTDTFGDYVKDISGTVGEIVVTGGTGEGSTPVISFSPNPTIGGNVTIGNDLQVNNNLNVTGNITVGGTAGYILVENFRVSDADIVLGFTTDSQGNDVSTDITANHGGIAIASTEGYPLVNLNIAGIETLPPTYKKFMWFQAGAFAGLNTDAWLSNYAIGIGSTQFPAGTRLAAGSVQFTENDLAVVRNINASGIITAASFSGNSSSATYATTSGFSTFSGYANTSGFSTFSGYANNAGIATYAVTAGVSTYSGVSGFSTFSGYSNTSGFSTFSGYANVSGIATYARTAGVSTYSGVSGFSTFSGYSNTSGFSTFSGYANVSGIATYAVTAGVSTYSGVAGFSTFSGYANTSGFSTFSGYANNSGIATYAVTAGVATYAGVSGFSTFSGYANTAGIATYATTAGVATYAGVSGFSTFSGYSNTSGFSTFSGYANNAGIATYAWTAGVSTYSGVAGFSTFSGYANTSGFSTFSGYANNAGIATYAVTAGVSTYAGVSGFSTFSGYADSSGVSTFSGYANVSGIATYAVTSGVSTYAGIAGVSTSVIGGIASVTSLNATGISTIAGVQFTPTGIVTASTVSGIVTYYGDGSKLTGISAGAFNIINQPLTSTTVYPTFAANIGVASVGITSTQVAYIPSSNRLGIGTTNPNYTLEIVGNTRISGLTSVTNLEIYGTVGAGNTVGNDGQYLKSTGVGVTWASFPTLRTTGITTATQGQTVFNFAYNVGFLDVYVNGVKLINSEFTAVNGANVTLQSQAFSGDIVEFVSYNTVSTGSGSGGAGSISLDSLTDVVITSPQTGETLTFDGTYWINDYTFSTTTATTSQVPIHTLSSNDYRSVEYMIQVTNGTNYHLTKLLVLHNGTIASNTEYGTISTGPVLATFDTDITGGAIRLLATPYSSSTMTYKIKFTAIKV